MTERGMLFSGPLVRAILDGRKTETRRPVTASSSRAIDGDGRAASWPDLSNCVGDETLFTMVDDDHAHDGNGERWISPHWKAGERIWVLETHAPKYFDDGSTAYAADWTVNAADVVNPPKWTPSIHMRREHSRINLLVTEVSAERIQDITWQGARAEGVGTGREGFRYHRVLVDQFQLLWDQIYRDRVNAAGEDLGLGWTANPWVWTIKFEVVA